MIVDTVKNIHDYLSLYFQSTLFDVLSVVISGVALLLAIFVPVRIARRQNKIALFEKRFAAYSDLLKLKSFAEILKNECHSFGLENIRTKYPNPVYEINTRVRLVLIHFGSIFGYHPIKLGEADTIQATIAAIKKVEISVNMLPLLYSKKMNKDETASKEITEIFESLLKFMSDIVIPNGPIGDENRADFIERVSSFVKKYVAIIEKGIKL